MSSLSIEEALNVSESFLVTLYGYDVYKRWTDMKYRMNFTTERQFVLWIMDWLEDQENATGQLDMDPAAIGMKQSTSCVNETYDDNIESRQQIRISSSYSQHRENRPPHSTVAVKPSQLNTSARGSVKRVGSNLPRSSQQVSKQQKRHTSTDMESMKLERVQDGGVYHAASTTLSNDNTEDADCEIIDSAVSGVKQETLPAETLPLQLHSEVGDYDENEMLAVTASENPDEAFEATHADDDGGVQRQYRPYSDHVASTGSTALDFTFDVDVSLDDNILPKSDVAAPIAVGEPMACAEGSNCQYCGRKFQSSSTLRRHINDVHLKIKRYCCPTCGKGFAQASTLKNHTKLCAVSGDISANGS